MRKAFKGGWLVSNKGEIIGVSLGADYCAEHEWGIKGIKRAFGIKDDDAVFGIEKRRITKLPENNRFFSDEKAKEAFVFKEAGTKKMPEAFLIYSQWDANEFTEHRELTMYKYDPKRNEERDNFVAAWSEGDFGIHVRGVENVNKLREIWTAFQNKDIAIWLGGGGVFQNAGLSFGIVSRVPEPLKEIMRAKDEDTFKLRQAAEATGLEAYLKSKRVHKEYAISEPAWLALSPAWINEEAKHRSKHPVMFWLNHMEQDKNNYGWFTVEELMKWGEGRGPVIKTAKQLKKEKA